MIDPEPCRAMGRVAAWIVCRVPIVLRSIVALTASTSAVASGPMCVDPPAQANTASSLPVGSSAAATAVVTSSGVVTSATT